MKNYIYLLITLTFFFTCCVKKESNDSINQNDSNLPIINSSFTDEEILFMKNNDLSVNDVLPYKKYHTFNINYYYIYEKYRQGGYSHLEAINLGKYPSYFQGYYSAYDALFTDTNLMLVNKSFAVKTDFIPNFLVSIETFANIDYIKRTNDSMLIDYETLRNYNDMYNAAKKENIQLVIYSAYRTYQKQHYLYYTINNQNDNYSAKPGYSEHHTGKALDISDNIHGLTLNFAKSETYNWLKNNAYKFGFILRYPQNKEHITKYNFEPWHYRYVGIENAKLMYDKNITLEEFLLANYEF